MDKCSESNILRFYVLLSPPPSPPSSSASVNIVSSRKALKIGSAIRNRYTIIAIWMEKIEKYRSVDALLPNIQKAALPLGATCRASRSIKADFCTLFA
ncbi:unnamed protein product [Nezara viridula]|uniref:Uncharacterized protein n=1 Tax=Nezara viridula TaxID=85310 RepID=A0A9P0MTQ0_NEZVI|nr:unnamed protein product [Nezara viridula]